MSDSLISSSTTVKVSSTLDKSVAKKYLIDGSPETCWTSQQGLPQFIQLGFDGRVIPSRLSITFQGGFVGTRCVVLVPLSSTNERKSDWQNLTSIYPEDVNRRQIFDLKSADASIFEQGVSGIKLVFEESSDFFGRITVYDLQLEGKKLG